MQIDLGPVRRSSVRNGRLPVKLLRGKVPTRLLMFGGLIAALIAVSSQDAAMAASPGTGSPAASATPMSAPAAGSGWIRFGHFVPSQGPVTVTAGTVVLGTDLVFRSVTPYISVPAGTYTVTVRSSSAATTAPPLVTGQADVVSGGAVTAAAIAAPSSSSANASSAIEVKMFADNLSAPASGQAKVRVIHALPGVPAVTTQLSQSAPSGSPALSSQPALALAPTGYGQASPYLSVPAGTYQLKVGPAGKPSLVSGQNWPVKAGTVASIVLVETSNGPTIEVLSDAVTTASAPVGGLQTGDGGTAPKPAGPLMPVAIGVAVLLLGGAGVRRRVFRSI
jgi:hypothetical protein